MLAPADNAPYVERQLYNEEEKSKSITHVTYRYSRYSVTHVATFDTILW